MASEIGIRSSRLEGTHEVRVGIRGLTDEVVVEVVVIVDELATGSEMNIDHSTGAPAT